ncbi:MAG: uncharacterized protein QOI09_306 [Chloroflexota bacterium]|nr:uncharacterized protein [Chloroflexota bacterium]
MTADDGPRDVAGILELADWRRAVAALYADVRRLAGTDPAAALAHWRKTRQALYRDHPQSPVLAGERGSFRARHFKHDPALRFEVLVEPPPEEGQTASPGLGGFGAAGGPGGLSIELPVSVGGVMSFSRVGTVAVPFAAGARRLELYWMAGYAGGLFLPFRDATNGTETYGAGRYLLDAAKSADLGRGREPGTLVLDFNFAYQPSCAFDPKYACPLSPPANRLDLPVRAGERLA